MHHVSDPEWQVDLGARPAGYLPTFSGASREFSGPMQEKRSQITKGDNSQHCQRSGKKGNTVAFSQRELSNITIGEREITDLGKRSQDKKRENRDFYHQKPWEYH